MSKKRIKRKFGLRIDKNWDAPKLSDDERRQKMCGDKELRSKQDAQTQAQLHSSKGEPMQAYKCPYCPYWHIGRKWD